jgi:DNA-binding transcriptional MerR regulator
MAKRAHSSIGDVLNQLRDEFPDITISKIRFLESQGLVDPERTPSGYRKFYPADVERLRFILREQREHFLPLKVIKERLDEIDKNGGFNVDENSVSAQTRLQLIDEKTVDQLFEETRRAAQEAEARSVTSDIPDEDEGPEDLAFSSTGVSLTRAELAQAAGISDDDLGRLEEYGLVAPSHTTHDRVLFDEDALAVARVCGTFMQHGIEPRHLRMYRAFADREASLFDQVLLPYRRQRNPEAQARSTETLGELAGLGRRLRTAVVRQAVRRGFNG